ncbi:MAG: PD-(D/E)XK nuclease family transposase [Spirochaetales bacterium]|nr:PD-(D/E)XK nuclease family transposase [Spirochaetales bacterium]
MPNTSLGDNLVSAGSGARYDKSAKRIMSFKSVLAWTLKSICTEFSDLDLKYIERNCIVDVSISNKAVHQDHPDRKIKLGGDERVTAMNSESVSKKDGTVYFDLRFRARVPEKEGDVYLIMNIEIQNKNNPIYRLVSRGIYYCSRMISEQYGTVFKDMDYHKIQKVYSIWICPMPKDTKRKSSITRYMMTKRDEVGKSFIDKRYYDKMETVVIKLGREDDYSSKPITGLLSVLFSPTMPIAMKKRILSGDYGIAMTKKFEREVLRMCNLSYAVMEEGRIQGRKQGRKQGREEGQLEMLNKLIKIGKLSIEDAAYSVDMTVEDFLKKKEKYQKKSL